MDRGTTVTDDADRLTDRLDALLAGLADLTAALRPAITPAQRPTWDQMRWAPAPDAFGPDQAAALDIAPLAAVDPDGTPGNVVANELIESAWGNAVADSIDRIALPNHLAGNADALGQLRLATGQVATVLDPNGLALVTFPVPFVSVVTVLVTNADWTNQHVASATSITLANFTLSVRRLVSGAVAAGEVGRVNWLAIGRR